MLNGTAIMNNSTTVPQLIQHRISLWSSNFTSCYMPQRVKARKQADNLLMFMATTLTIIKKVETTQMSIDEK